ncbi:alpha/beta fold hydrolase [Synechococcus sp. BMK-MC-1]|uniref:alpha/beta fold hydrolase n=1 Tax=Synechococcus sp. BMK-MC-1 TaxID=1442551 RepID=UPI0016493080|nr:alpha/beta fold hydrolase [Synechococcus sp. BMK-MC-1]QNI66259.1 alpha/beta hydrolase fold family protein [Synechococcus sp. BMK-MC-1]
MPAEPEHWTWEQPDGRGLDVVWRQQGQGPESSDAPAVVLVHGFGASSGHWRYTMPSLATQTPTFALDLIGFGGSSQPKAVLPSDPDAQRQTPSDDALVYGFDLWAAQVEAFCRQIVQRPVLLVGNSIGGVVVLRAAQRLGAHCQGVVLIDCAQRLMDDKQLASQPAWMAWIRPLLKTLVSQRWLSTALFRNAARPRVIRSVLGQAYPSGANVDDALVDLLYQPTQRPGAAEAFRGFINLFDDHLAPELLATLEQPVHLIWGERDPWEPVAEAQDWAERFACIQSLTVLPRVGHCPHDEAPEAVNARLLEILKAQAA